MKFTANRRELAEAWALVTRAAASKSPKPILQGVRVTADAEGLTLEATDLEVGIRRRLAVPAEPGKVPCAIVPGARLAQILSRTGAEEVTVETEDGDDDTALQVRVTADGSRFSMLTDDPADYPMIPGPEGEPSFEMGGKKLAQMIRLTAFATEPDSTRYALNGVLFQLGPDGLNLAATDGRRMAVCQSPQTKGDGMTPQCVVPNKGLSLLTSLGEEADAEKVQVHLTGNHVVATGPNGSVYSRLVEGRFPKWQDVMPKGEDPKLRITVPVVSMLNAIRQAQVMTSEKSMGAKFTFSNQSLCLRSRAETGTAEVTIPLPAEERPETVVILNPFYMADPLRVMGQSTEVELLVWDASRAVVLRAGQYRYLQMPLVNEQNA